MSSLHQTTGYSLQFQLPTPPPSRPNLIAKSLSPSPQGIEGSALERRSFSGLVGDAMSAYDNVVGGKLKLKGKALDVKAGGVKKKKKHKKPRDDQVAQVVEDDHAAGQSVVESTDLNEEDIDDGGKLSGEGKPASSDHLTAAEKRYKEQREKLDIHKMAKDANKSHRDRIEGFNRYLANLSEHYDIPKVGPG